MGEGRNPGTEHFMKLAEKFSISGKDAKRIMDEVHGAVSDWPVFAGQAGVSATSKKLIANVINKVA